MLRFGFELEGFYLKDTVIQVPPANCPVDGFPGLIELRSTGGKDLYEAYCQVIEEFLKLELDGGHILISEAEHKFSGADMQFMRKKRTFNKQQVDVRNIYGKPMRNLNGKTIASLQINISNKLRSSYKDDKGVFHPDEYGLLDTHALVKSLDKTFADCIKLTNRQPGMYAIKDDYRLEYRSLPNCILTLDPYADKQVLNNINLAIKEAGY